MMSPHGIFWTGGWDSTFRILDLVVRQRKPVQPYYVINTNRKSFAMELQTIVALKNRIQARYPASAALMAPVIYVELSDIRPHQALTEAYGRLAERGHLGSQYEYLARFADQSGPTDIELCIERHSHAWEMLQQAALCQDDGQETVYRLSDEALATDLRLFGYYTFPLFDLTKKEMEARALAAGFSDLLERTWFCHTPLEDGRPCGQCNPCKIAIAEGFGRRVPPAPSRFRALLRQVLPPVVVAWIRKARRAYRRRHKHP